MLIIIILKLPNNTFSSKSCGIFFDHSLYIPVYKSTYYYTAFLANNLPNKSYF